MEYVKEEGAERRAFVFLRRTYFMTSDLRFTKIWQEYVKFLFALQKTDNILCKR
jgi:hypothetical protein